MPDTRPDPLATLPEFDADQPMDVLIAKAALTQPQPDTGPLETVAAWMIGHGFATGHGDTLDDLLSEMEWQVAALRSTPAPEPAPLDVDRLARALHRFDFNGKDPSVICPHRKEAAAIAREYAATTEEINRGN